MSDIIWNRAHLDTVLEALATAMSHQTGTHKLRYKIMHSLFHSIGSMALTEEPFRIYVDPKAPGRMRERESSDNFQNVVDQVRERRQAARVK